MEYHRIKQKYQSHIYQFNDGSLKDNDRRPEGEDRAQGGVGLDGSGKKTKNLSPVRVD
jgi:hypothetical protein